MINPTINPVVSLKAVSQPRIQGTADALGVWFGKTLKLAGKNRGGLMQQLWLGNLLGDLISVVIGTSSS